MRDTSQKQIEANKENAKKGGVKTEEGKAISKYNALKHGLLSKEVLIEGEDERQLVELGKKLRSEFSPSSELEIILVERIIANTWRLKRAMRIEQKFMGWQYKWKFRNESKFPDEGDGEVEFDQKAYGQMIDTDRIEKLIRYETNLERGIYRALHELQRIQAARMGEKPPAPIAIDVDVSKEE